MTSPGSPSSSTSSYISSLSPPQKVTILYASETGNSQDIAERVGREFRRLGRRCTVISMDMFDVFELPDVQLLVLITSTHGRGDPPPAMLPLWNALLRSSLPEDILEDVNFALYGLGDSSYEKFCYAGKMLLRRLEGLGAKKMGEPAWGDERAPEGLEETFLPWLQQTIELMVPHLPPISLDFEPYPLAALPPPLYAMDPAPTGLSLDRLSLENGKDIDIGESRQELGHLNGQVLAPDKPSSWVWATLKKNERVTREGWWQDVREIELEFEGDVAPYEPASICSIQPKGTSEEVDEFLEMMGWSALADSPFHLTALSKDQPLPPNLPDPNELTSLRSLLTNYLDLRGSPRKSFFEWLRRVTPDEREQERLDEFLEDPDEIHDYATRPFRTINEVLADFRHTRLPLSHLLEIIPPLRRRQFSIASSWDSHPGKVQLLVAMVQFKTNLKIPRRGLCSSFWEPLPIGSRIPVKIDAPTLFLPENPQTPVILVGPGTGVAPMRALVEHRVRQGAAKNTALYFGCRSVSADMYYKAEWDHYRQLGLIVRIAASRDQKEKFYVQHIIKNDASMIREWILEKQGNIYISGASNNMPKEVRAAVAWCLTLEGGGEMSTEEAEEYVEEMFEAGRGIEESW